VHTQHAANTTVAVDATGDGDADVVCGGVTACTLCVTCSGAGNAAVQAGSVTGTQIAAAATENGDAGIVCADTTDSTLRATSNGTGNASVHSGAVVDTEVVVAADGDGDANVVCADGTDSTLRATSNGTGVAGVTGQQLRATEVSVAAAGDGDASVVCADVTASTVQATSNGTGGASVQTAGALGTQLSATASGNGSASVVCEDCEGTSSPAAPTAVVACAGAGNSQVTAGLVQEGATVTAETHSGDALVNVVKADGGTVNVLSATGTGHLTLSNTQQDTNSTLSVRSGGDASAAFNNGLRAGTVTVTSIAGRVDVHIDSGMRSSGTVRVTLDAFTGAALDIINGTRRQGGQLNVLVRTVNGHAEIRSRSISASTSAPYSVVAVSDNGTTRVCSKDAGPIPFVSPDPEACY